VPKVRRIREPAHNPHTPASGAPPTRRRGAGSLAISSGGGPDRTADLGIMSPASTATPVHSGRLSREIATVFGWRVDPSGPATPRVPPQNRHRTATVASVLARCRAALDPPVPARTDAVKVVPTRLGAVAVEVDADRPTPGAVRAAAGLVGERRQVRLLDGRGGDGAVYHGRGSHAPARMR
jgi:hypothetical protein